LPETHWTADVWATQLHTFGSTQPYSPAPTPIPPSGSVHGWPPSTNLAPGGGWSSRHARALPPCAPATMAPPAAGDLAIASPTRVLAFGRVVARMGRW